MLSLVGVLVMSWRTPVVINGENELLDVRVCELTDVVDAFLVVESRYTQYGIEKPIRFAGHPNPKVIHVVSNWTIPGRTGCSLGWENEGHQRDHIIREGLASVYEHLRIPPYHMDILIITDADEIPRLTTIKKIRRQPPLDGRIYPIGMNRYLYSFAWREKNGNQQAFYGNIETWRQWKIYRKNPTWGPTFKRGGWHCTKCFRIETFGERLKDYLCGDGIRWGDYNWSTPTLRGLVSRGIWIGAFPHQRSRRAPIVEAPRAAHRYPYLVSIPKHTDPIRMPYCQDPNPALKHLKQQWCV